VGFLVKRAPLWYFCHMRGGLEAKSPALLVKVAYFPYILLVELFCNRRVFIMDPGHFGITNNF
jgi:hypothetical protein